MTEYDTQKPFLAAFVLFRKGNKVAFVLRQNTDWMNGFYGIAGAGKVEKGESFLECAIREAKEEVGVDLSSEHLKHVHTMHRKDTDSYWIDVYFEADGHGQEPQNAEPHMHESLEWLDIDNLPQNVIPPVAAVLSSISKGESYSEYGWTQA